MRISLLMKVDTFVLVKSNASWELTHLTFVLATNLG